MKTLRDVLEEAQAKHVIAVVREAYSMKEAANILGISQEHLRRLRHRYGMAIGTQGGRSGRKLHEIAA